MSVSVAECVDALCASAETLYPYEHLNFEYKVTGEQIAAAVRSVWGYVYAIVGTHEATSPALATRAMAIGTVIECKNFKRSISYVMYFYHLTGYILALVCRVLKRCRHNFLKLNLPCGKKFLGI